MKRSSTRRPPVRQGKVLVTLAVLLPTLLAIIGLIFDGGLLTSEQYVQQHATDAAALSAAMDIREGNPHAIDASVIDVVHGRHGLTDVDVSAFCPPTSGAFAGDSQYVEVLGTGQYRTSFVGLLGGMRDTEPRTRAVAGVDASTPGAAVVILDPLPEPLSLSDLPTLVQDVARLDSLDEALQQTNLDSVLSTVPLLSAIVGPLLDQEVSDELLATATETLDMVNTNLVATSLPALLAGLEIEGVGNVVVEGAVHVNNTWGGEDERGCRAGIAAGPPHAVACMPLLPTTRLVTPYLRVAGGVDKERYYLPLDPDDPSPLQANRLAVPDPLADLPVPSLQSDPDNVVSTPAPHQDVVDITLSVDAADDLLGRVSGALSYLLQPLFANLCDPLTQTLTESRFQPGVYNSITVLAPAGGVQFEPGVYIIRGKNPATGISLCLLGPIQVEGVMFYITDSSDYDADSGAPDAASPADSPPPHVTADLLPSVVIAPLLPGGRYTGIDQVGSPFHEMLLFQQRSDRRPIIFEGQHLVGNSDLSGTIYAKWGHTLFVGGAATHDLKIVSGTARIVTVGTTTIAPRTLLQPAEDVVLVE
ncbi:pilus assembly protein TadG-related protein [Roseimaritima ulvae]|uniref:Putative Flp pilus-assembly TadG-like N-terminal domain-containing protein n=1 Tax=Roseimaritima ulvae TaxID=980254 RepID=A0A5B9R019_9BACT|nr:pilus assembly protein TadG-related protein [Roseimaritima ulvae]QEG39613.1 hypothetical protein UC8_16090 [Roseimaritima ulvae]